MWTRWKDSRSFGGWILRTSARSKDRILYAPDVSELRVCPRRTPHRWTTFAVTSVNSLRCHASTWFRLGSKFRCMRSTPTETQAISENDFECLASTGVKHTGDNVAKFSGRDWEFLTSPLLAYQTLLGSRSDCSLCGSYLANDNLNSPNADKWLPIVAGQRLIWKGCPRDSRLLKSY